MMVLKILHGDGVFCSHWQFDKATVETILADFFQINIQLAEPDLIAISQKVAALI